MRTKITIALLICSISGMAQSGTVIPAPKTKPIKGHFSATSTPVLSLADTSETYNLKYKEVQLMYDLLSAGYQGVSTSDVFSKNQAKQYMQLVQHLDSLLKPQILKWHPAKGGQK